jgi:hypothetical protein
MKNQLLIRTRARAGYLGLVLGALLAVAVLSLIIEAASSPTPSSVSDSDRRAVLEVSRRGEDLIADGGSKATYFPANWHGGHVAPDVAARIHQKLASDLTAAFSTELAARYLGQIEAQLAKAEQSDPTTPEPAAMNGADLAAGKANYPIVRLSGRVNTMTIQELTVVGETAHLSATVDAFAEVAQVRAGHEYVAHPHNVIIVTEVLQKTSSGWRITARSWTFAPGGEP